jgi:hypothetical protein
VEIQQYEVTGMKQKHTNHLKGKIVNPNQSGEVSNIILYAALMDVATTTPTSPTRRKHPPSGVTKALVDHRVLQSNKKRTESLPNLELSYNAGRQKLPQQN